MRGPLTRCGGKPQASKGAFASVERALPCDLCYTARAASAPRT